MVKIKKAAMWLMVFLFISGSKVHAATYHGHHLATGIDVVCYRGNTQASRSFRQSDNMEAILNYLRLLQYAGIPAKDPEQSGGDTYRITVHLADGGHRVYHLHADRYLSRNFRPWEKVDSTRSLSTLLKSLPDE